MLKFVLKYIVSFICIFLIVATSSAQESKISGLNVGLDVGASRFIAEIPYDFSHKIIEFENEFGLSFGIELTKYLSNHWEIGTKFNYSVLNGKTDNSSFSAEATKIPPFQEPITEPVEYNNILTGQNLFFRFYLLPLNNQDGKVNMYPFINAGIGFINYKSKFQYIDPADGGIIFGKGTDGFASLSTACYSFGAGIKTSFSSKLSMMLSINNTFTNYDFLDVVHNYDSDKNRLALFGVFTEFKIGILYSLTPFQPSKGKNKKSSGSENLPFGR